MRLEILPRTELSLRLLTTIADGSRWRASDLAEQLGTTAPYVAQLVAPLTRVGWIRARPGPNGGHELAVDLRTLSVLDLITVVEGAPESDRCVMADRPCPAPEPCAMHDAWVPARDGLLARLAATPLHESSTHDEPSINHVSEEATS
ncbi:MAG: Rrf2 family transcriptional regulator [Acidimicrobiaceae bacterium]|nr:Rrf2 family transcriptional regulator [Acidimicrobiaceae bacterium]